MKKLIGLIALFVLFAGAFAPAVSAQQPTPPQAPPVVGWTFDVPQAPAVKGCECGGVGPCECGPWCTCASTYRSIMADDEQPQAPKTKKGAVQGFDGWAYCEGGYHHAASGWCQSGETGLYFTKSSPGVFYSFEAMKAKCADDCAGGACSPQGYMMGNGGCGAGGCGAPAMGGYGGGQKGGFFKGGGGFFHRGGGGKGGCGG